jgi:hypothetical protein
VFAMASNILLEKTFEKIKSLEPDPASDSHLQTKLTPITSQTMLYMLKPAKENGQNVKLAIVSNAYLKV